VIKYRVNLTPDDNDTFLVTSSDFPEVTTCGDTRVEALKYAVGAFQEVIASYVHHKKPIPKPSKIRPKDDFITLPLQTELKIRMYESMRDSGMKKSELARKMKLHRQEMERLLDFNKSTNLDRIESAFAAMGKRVSFEVADAD
jgi:antitoxin HicB